MTLCHSALIIDVFLLMWPSLWLTCYGTYAYDSLMMFHKSCIHVSCNRRSSFNIQEGKRGQTNNLEQTQRESSVMCLMCARMFACAAKWTGMSKSKDEFTSVESQLAGVHSWMHYLTMLPDPGVQRALEPQSLCEETVMSVCFGVKGLVVDKKHGRCHHDGFRQVLLQKIQALCFALIL